MATRPGEVRINIVGNADRLKRATDDASRNLTKFGDDVEKKLKKVGDGFASLGRTVGLGIAALGAGAIVLGTQAINAASDLAEVMSKTRVLFGDAAGTVVAFAEQAASALGQSKKVALEGATTFAVFGSAAGLSGEALAQFATDNVRLAADLASFANTSPEDALYAIGAAFRGEMEPIRKYGVMLDDATLKQKASELGIYDGNGALTQQQKVLAANAAILDQTGAAQGDFERTSDGLANQSRILKAELENVKAEIGEELLPIFLRLAQFINDDLIPKLKALWEEHGPEIRRVFAQIKEQLKPIAEAIERNLVPALKKLAEFAKNNTEVVAAFFLVLAGVAVIAGIAALVAAINPVTLAIIGIGIAVAAVVGGLVYLYNRFDAVKTIADALGQMLLWTFGTVMGWIAGAVEGFKTILETVGPFAANVWRGIKNTFIDGVNGVIRILNGLIRAYNTIRSALGLSTISTLERLETEQDRFRFYEHTPTNEPLSGLSGLQTLMGRAIGGPVPGTPGQAVPMMLHAGEYVLTASQMARMNANEAGHTFNITVNQSNATASDIAREIAWQMKTMGR